MHLTKNVKFDEKNIFYDKDINAPQNFENFDNESEIKEFWSSEDDSLLDVHSQRNWFNESEKIQTFMTSKSLSKDDNDDGNINENDETEEEKNFADATDLQSSSLFINIISKNVMSASQQTQSMREPLSNEQLQAARKEHTDKLINKNAETASNIVSVSESIVSSINSSWKRDKDFVPITVDRSTRFKTDKLSSMNYKKLHNSEKRSKGTINYLNDLYNVKHIFNLYNHMQRALNALMIKKNFELEHVSEWLIYKQALNVTDLLLRGRSPEGSGSIKNASHTARCLKEVQVSDTDRLRRS